MRITPKAVVLVLAVAAAAAAAAAADLPLMINYQGKLLTPSTNAPRNGTFQFTARIYDAPSGGALLYTDVQPGIAVSNGVFFLQIGAVTPLTPDLFTTSPRYLSIEVDADGEMTPRQQLLMSPYAYTAAQLVGNSTVRVRVDTAYSTFTSAGNLLVGGGLVASSGTFANGVTASSFTALATTGAGFVTNSSATASAFFGDASHLSNMFPAGPASGDLAGSYPAPTLNPGSAHTWTAAQGLTNVALTLTGANGNVTTASSATASAFFGDGSHLKGLGTLNKVWVYTATGGTPWNYATALAAGVTSIYVEAIGGGGGGGSARCTVAADANSGGGGGGGGYAAKQLFLGVDVTANQTATAGGGGAGGLNTGSNPGSNGTNSSFGALVVAGFGTGGSAPMAQNTTVASVTGGAGGTGTTGDVLLSAGDGGRAVRFTGTHAWGGQGGGGARGSGVTPGGWVGAATTASAGSPGNQYGGGGGGSAVAGVTNSTGGAGANGVVIVWEFK